MRPHRITPIHPDGQSSSTSTLISEALPDSERYGGFVNFDHKICGDQLVLYGDFFYQNVKTSYDLAPTATGDFQTPGNITLAIPPHARRVQPLAGRLTMKPASRWEHSIHLTLFSKSSPVAPGRASLSLAIGLSITRPMLSFPPWG